MLLLGTEKINDSLLIEIYIPILTLNWIITRTLSSQKEICKLCNLKKCNPPTHNRNLKKWFAVQKCGKKNEEDAEFRSSYGTPPQNNTQKRHMFQPPRRTLQR